MAAINIIETNGLFKIEMDYNDWTGLYVNGAKVSQNDSGGWTYKQPSPGTLTIEATADFIQTKRENSILVLKDGDKDYLCSLCFTEKGKPFKMYGTLSVGTNIQSAQEGPILFSQGSMTGGFSKG